MPYLSFRRDSDVLERPPHQPAGRALKIDDPNRGDRNPFMTAIKTGCFAGQMWVWLSR